MCPKAPHNTTQFIVAQNELENAQNSKEILGTKETDILFENDTFRHETAPETYGK